MKGLTIKLLILISLFLLHYLDTSGSTTAAASTAAEAEAEAKAEDKKTKAVMILPDIQKQKRDSELSHSHEMLQDGFEQPSPTTYSAQRDLKKKKQPPAPANKRTRARASEPEGKGDKNKKTAPNPGVRPKRYREHQCTMKPFLGSWIYQNGCGGDPWMVRISCEKKGRRGGGLMCSYYEDNTDEDSGYCSNSGVFNSKDSLHADGKGNCLLGPINLHPDATVDDEDCSLNSSELMVKIMPMPVNKNELKIYFSEDGGDTYYNEDEPRLASRILGYDADGNSGSGGSSKGGKKIDRRLVEKTISHLERKLLCRGTCCRKAKGVFASVGGGNKPTTEWDQDNNKFVYHGKCWTSTETEALCWTDINLSYEDFCKPKGPWVAASADQYTTGTGRGTCGDPCETFENNQCSPWEEIILDLSCKQATGSFDANSEVDVCWKAVNGGLCWSKTFLIGGNYYQCRPEGPWKALPQDPSRSKCGNACHTFEFENPRQCFADDSTLRDFVTAYIGLGCKDGPEKCPGFTSQYGWPIGSWCVGKVTDMNRLFMVGKNDDDPHGIRLFNEDISLWDVSNVRTMERMFFGAHEFNGDLSLWEVGQVTDMTGMFEYAQSFNGDISLWDVSQVTDMSYMFFYAHKFNGDLSLWNVNKVQDMQRMFYDAESFNGNISLWDVGQVTDMSYMFYDAHAFNNDLSSWDIKKVQDMSAMFFYAEVFNQNLCAWAQDFPYLVFDWFSPFDTLDIFENTKCKHKDDPNKDQGGPFCASDCNCCRVQTGKYCGSCSYGHPAGYKHRCWEANDDSNQLCWTANSNSEVTCEPRGNFKEVVRADGDCGDPCKVMLANQC